MSLELHTVIHFLSLKHIPKQAILSELEYVYAEEDRTDAEHPPQYWKGSLAR
jgi:hypothetical protein